ncbi:hypothetical protein [Psychrobacter sp. 16-MNA-CIBAN-0192]|uniref:hypothetical protein n=1 Tax=Psychrobacter sp. 16-MNA-CIBAN-0192 TaxID=3140448 RepID=UPI00331AB48B
MKVSNLIDKLSKLDPNLEVYGICDEETIDAKELFFLFDIDSIDTARVVTGRDNSNKPVISFENSQDSREMAFINLTTIF